MYIEKNQVPVYIFCPVKFIQSVCVLSSESICNYQKDAYLSLLHLLEYFFFQQSALVLTELLFSIFYTLNIQHFMHS